MPVTEYTWDPTTDSVLEETDGAGHVRVSYTNEPSQYGPLLSQHRDGESRYFHFDALGSTRELTDDDENLTDTFTYDAWGSILSHVEHGLTSVLWNGWLGYSHIHAELCRYYTRRRIYMPHTLRWTAADPAEGMIAFNQYSYADLSPTMNIDPSGLVTLTIRPTLRNHRWEDAPRLAFRGQLRFNPPERAQDQITCRCVQCPGSPERKSLECKMTIDTTILINVRTIFYPRQSDEWRYLMHWRYGHEQQHAKNLQAKFVELAVDVSRLELQYQCADNCNPDVIDRIVGIWHGFRVAEAAHDHEPWFGDQNAAAATYIQPIDASMPGVTAPTGNYQ